MPLLPEELHRNSVCVCAHLPQFIIKHWVTQNKLGVGVSWAGGVKNMQVKGCVEVKKTKFNNRKNCEYRAAFVFFILEACWQHRQS